MEGERVGMIGLRLFKKWPVRGAVHWRFMKSAKQVGCRFGHLIHCRLCWDKREVQREEPVEPWRERNACYIKAGGRIPFRGLLLLLSAKALAWHSILKSWVPGSGSESKPWHKESKIPFWVWAGCTRVGGKGIPGIWKERGKLRWMGEKVP